ncbi:hypothetical protein U1Q18_012202 [Sarracenia purpurea var. burkii]
MLEDVMLRLRISGFSVLALALRVKHSELSDLRAMTVFALDDASIFDVGHSFVSDLNRKDFYSNFIRRLLKVDRIDPRRVSCLLSVKPSSTVSEPFVLFFRESDH